MDSLLSVYGLNSKLEQKHIVGYMAINNRNQANRFESSDTLLKRIYQVKITSTKQSNYEFLKP